MPDSSYFAIANAIRQMTGKTVLPNQSVLSRQPGTLIEELCTLGLYFAIRQQHRVEVKELAHEMCRAAVKSPD